MKRFLLFSMFTALTAVLLPSDCDCGPVSVSQVIFLSTKCQRDQLSRLSDG